MAKDLALDLRTMDLDWPLRFISGKAEVQQALIGLIMTKKGSFLDYPEVGMDYTFLDSEFNPEELRLSVNNALKQDKRVTHIDNINVNPEKGHKVSITAKVETTLGTISLNKEMKIDATNG